MLILGLNAFHGDSAACLVKDGNLIAAVEEERFRRIKHWAGFPREAIAYCLAEAGISLDQVDHVAINQDTGANFSRKLRYALLQWPSLGLVLDRIRNHRKRTSIATYLQEVFPDQACNAEVHEVEHHRAHLSSAFHVSPFEQAVVVSMDGFGDFASAAWGIGRGNLIDIDGRAYFPHSLGIFYQALTQHLGFPHYGDEYKVMGLAPYGKPTYLDAMRKIVRLKNDGGFSLNLAYFRHHKERIAFEWETGEPVFGELFSPALEDLLGPQRDISDEIQKRHHDIAHSVQAMYEEAFFNMLNALHARHPTDAVAIAGGCGMNSVANGKIHQRTPFNRIYVQSAPGDAGGAIGAAFSVWHSLGHQSNFIMDHAYWGPWFSSKEIGGLLDERKEDIASAGCAVEVVDDEVVFERTAQAIANGLVVGWFQGRMEWGPRALGNRSILGDPRRADMKDILNQKIKRRESFRPFAPSILRDHVADWFESDGDVPFMMQVYQIQEEKQSRIPAVTHVDGSGRLQTVDAATNPRYYAVIKRLYELTGVPIVLNTSFNENEPVVCKPEEALNCFLRTNMDFLVLGNHLVSRER